MHRRLLSALLLGAVALAAVGCAGSGNQAARPDAVHRTIMKHSTPVIPPHGILYTKYKAPLAPAPGRIGRKTGRATAHQIGLPPLPFPGLTTGLDLFAWGDASEETAREKGNLSEVSHSDYEVMEILLIYRRFTTIAYGD